LAMNPDDSPARHLERLGLTLASPLETEVWLSRHYWEQTSHLGRRLREQLTLERIGRRFREIIDEVLTGHQRR